MDEDADLRALLVTLDSRARDDFRRVLIRDQADRDAVTSYLMRNRDQTSDVWADTIDLPPMYPDSRRRVLPVLGEIEAHS